jgi:hypothetical protein
VAVVVVVRDSQAAQRAAVVVVAVDTPHQERLEPARTSLGEVHLAQRRSQAPAAKAGRAHFRPTAATLSTEEEEEPVQQMPAARRQETTAEVLSTALAAAEQVEDFQRGRLDAPEEPAEPRRSTQQEAARRAALRERRVELERREAPL